MNDSPTPGNARRRTLDVIGTVLFAGVGASFGGIFGVMWMTTLAGAGVVAFWLVARPLMYRTP